MSLSPLASTPVLRAGKEGGSAQCREGLCPGHVGFGEPPEQGKDLLGAGHRTDTRGGSTVEEKVG